MHRDSQCIVGSLTIKQTVACFAGRTLTVKMLWNGGQLVMNASVFITRVLPFPYRGIVPSEQSEQIHSYTIRRKRFDVSSLLQMQRGIAGRELHPALQLLQVDATQIKEMF